MHGGKSLSGVAAPHYAGAGRSRVVPERWAESYQGAQEDPDLLSLRHDIAITDAQIDELVSKLPDTQEEVAVFESFVSTFGQMKGQYLILSNERTQFARKQKAQEEFYRLFEAASLLQNQVTRYRMQELEISGRVMELREQRRKLVDSETKRLTAAVQSIRVDSVKAILWALLDILRREIPDRKLLQRIQDRFRDEFQNLAGRKL